MLSWYNGITPLVLYDMNSNLLQLNTCLICELAIASKRKFCSHSCAATFNNRGKRRHGRARDMDNCRTCKKALRPVQKEYCSHACARNKQYVVFLENWLNGVDDGVRDGGMRSSRYIRKWLVSQYEEKCILCGWCQVNNFTKKIPVQVDHIDGNALNNRPENLRLLCPSCHSLTATYGAANRGKGREIRRKNYKCRGSSTGRTIPS